MRWWQLSTAVCTAVAGLVVLAAALANLRDRHEVRTRHDRPRSAVPLMLPVTALGLAVLAAVVAAQLLVLGQPAAWLITAAVALTALTLLVAGS
jgi:uncharacterized membrane protein YidH (DUF202 family)